MTDTATRLRERAEELKSGWPVLAGQLFDAADELSRTAAQNAELRDGLQICAAMFREYEALHAAKGTPDGKVKARRNALMAQGCLALLDGKTT